MGGAISFLKERRMALLWFNDEAMYKPKLTGKQRAPAIIIPYTTPMETFPLLFIFELINKVPAATTNPDNKTIVAAIFCCLLF